MRKKDSRSGELSGFLDNGTSFSGELHFEGTLRVDGNLSGTVTTPDVLIVGSTSTVRADITAGTVQIHGRVIGDVSCSTRVEICPGGHLEGNVRTPKLVIEEGGNFQGQSRPVESEGNVEASPATTTPIPAEAEASSPLSGAVEEPSRAGSSRWRILSRQMDGLRASASAVDDVDAVVEGRD